MISGLVGCILWVYFYNKNKSIASLNEANERPGSSFVKLELTVNYYYSPAAKDAVLAKFEGGLVISELPEYWDQKLGESRMELIKDFENKGLITLMPDVDKLECIFSLTELKDMCRANGLKVSGKKIELSKRLFENDRPSMSDLVKDSQLMGLTERGYVLVNQYREKRKADYQAARDKILIHLSDGNMTDAIKTSHEYKSKQVWGNGYDEKFDMDFLSGVLHSKLGNKEEKFEAALIHLVPK